MIYREIDGNRMPALGFGTWELSGESGISAIRTALDTGYRHIDTAVRYDNETEVGTALRASGIAREELFVTTKVWHDSLRPEQVARSVSRSLERLQLEQVDLLLVHWPSPEGVPLDETLAAFAEARDAGQTRLIGVSNFPTALIAEAVDRLGSPVRVNQVEYHPFLDQSAVRDALRARDMVLTAYQPIAAGAVFGTPVLEEIARRHGKSAAQVSLRWLLQQDGVAAIPRSGNPANIRSNFDIFDFALSEAEMAEIFALTGNGRRVNPGFAPEWDRLEPA
ncbi:aldo/keto reductase (plasmid) [Paroceanicella profunda]|uniref:Aldo/keto reductase n=1 Tax=Paroceanicella profunda TaxID=2579971 RepID=A0A5B8FJ22_9RHOB|nr:aldo/keto reductase [Paroceanicella profunda]QDL93947.1 aldo/keto reductase [Paroceanicella profunda]